MKKNNKKKILSKSSLKLGIQCPKQLWLKVNKAELLGSVSSATQYQFDEGNEVGEMARKLEGKGELVDSPYWDYLGASKRTGDLIEKGVKLIYEASFLKNNLFVRVDILKKERLNWHLIEVKKTTSVKEDHIVDCAIQTIVLESCGIDLKTISIRHINKEMKFPHFNDFFETVDITDEVKSIIPEIKKKITSLKKNAFETKEVEREIGSHCSSPYSCMFSSYCWKKVPDYSIFDLPRLKGEVKWDLFDSGKIKIKQLSSKEYNEITARAIESTKKNQLFIDKNCVKNEINKWQWPLYFFDFETLNLAIPKYKGVSPYQQIPFQYSLHIWESKNKKKIIHKEFLHTNSSDPRDSLLKSLVKDLAGAGSIVSYNMSFEKQVIKKLAEYDKKNRKNLEGFIEKFVDPLPLFQKYIYHRDFRGSFSIKSVAPALIGERLNYDQLDIGDGVTAQVMAAIAMFGDNDSKEKEIIRENLLKYCEQDTRAMVDLVKWLFDNSR